MTEEQTHLMVFTAFCLGLVTTVLWQMLKKKEKYRLGGVRGCHLQRKTDKRKEVA